jgi:hypothetical protein
MDLLSLMTQFRNHEVDAATATKHLESADPSSLKRWLQFRGLSFDPLTPTDKLIRIALSDASSRPLPFHSGGPPDSPAGGVAATGGNSPTAPGGGGADEYCLINLKVICWIPAANFDDALPNAWVQSGLMGTVEQEALRGMFATGNPDPPGEFPTRDVFVDFVEAKEYRAILNFDMLVCRRNNVIHTVRAARRTWGRRRECRRRMPSRRRLRGHRVR